ncbi:MAG: hypothetical protein BMS9Abin37_1610 [Acidobacteriota bacterium]|nr:MAG: hypothetical protein BMS9Abin37_1610 [Acidobacteriota bacterium]
MRKLIFVFILFMAVMLPTLSFSQSVAQVTTVEVPGANTAKYVTAVKALIPLINKHSPNAEVRIWQATVAGTSSNRISVVVEYPSLAAWAEGGPKLAADPEFHGALRKFEGMGRKILSVSLATEQ